VSFPRRIPTLRHGSGCKLGNVMGGTSSCAILGGFAIGTRGFRCYDNKSPNAECQRVLVLARSMPGLICYGFLAQQTVQQNPQQIEATYSLPTLWTSIALQPITKQIAVTNL